MNASSGMKVDTARTRGDLVFDPPMPRGPSRRIFRAADQMKNGRSMPDPRL